MFANKRCNMWVTTAVSAAAVFALGAVMFIPVAQAETPFDIEFTGSGWCYNVLPVSNFDIFFEGLAGKGTVKSHHENKVFDNCTYEIMTVRVGLEGRGGPNVPDGEGLGIIKMIDKDGDFVVLVNRIGQGKMHSELVYGTGKWQGISGSSEDEIISRQPPGQTWTWTTRSRGTFKLLPPGEPKPRRRPPGGPPPGGMPPRVDKGPKVGDMAPTFKLMSIDGKKEFDLEAFRGKKPVVLFFGSYS